MHDDSSETADAALAARRAHAKQQQIYRRRRTVAGASLLLAVLLLAFGIRALFSGGTETTPVTLRPPAVQATTKLVKPTLRQLEDQAVQKTLARMPLVAVAGKRNRDVALTFDDGPGPYTLRVARVLERYKVPATFFQVGQAAKVFTDAEHAQLKDPSFVLGNHTETHGRLSSMDADQQASELDDAAGVITAAGGSVPRLFRPPFGAFDHTTLGLLNRRHMLTVLWTVDSQDYMRPGVAKIVQNVMDGVRPGAIVLMHDAGGDRSQTIAALPQIIKKLRAKHYHLVTIPRLLYDAPPPLRQPPIQVGVG
ncbi:MAG: polysaccharide deacetylase family protein [Solirubrobacteraceae bacterium]|nr:polysaccharide deacetylase family protein [Patulibacter sp.]